MSLLSTPLVTRFVRYGSVPLVLVVMGVLGAANPYWTHLATAAAIAYMLTSAFNLVYGYAGTFNLAIVATT